MGWPSFWRCRRLLALALLPWPALAMASGLQVTPIGLQLRGEQAAEALWLSNTGSETVHAQVRVFHWTQQGGSEQLQPSPELLLSPPMLNLAPGERQLVRVIRAGAAPSQEQAYRVLVDELPLPGADKPGLQFVLRYSIPVFVEPERPPQPVAELRARLLDSGSGARLSVRNLGAGHAQLAAVALLLADGRSVDLAPGLLGYALAGSEMSWPLPPGVASSSTQLRARVNGEQTARTLPLDQGDR